MAGHAVSSTRKRRKPLKTKPILKPKKKGK